MRKQMSSMTAQEFVEITAALGLKYYVLAQMLGRSHTSVSHYSTGKKPIPTEVVEKLRELCALRAKELTALTNRVVDTVADMVIATNEIRSAPNSVSPDRLHSSELTLAHRLKPKSGRHYPPYRMTFERFTVFVRALALWQEECQRRVQKVLSDERRIRMHHYELSDIRAISAALPQHAPYEIVIEVEQWHVVSRALRFAGTNDARALWDHWRRHRGAGFPHTRNTRNKQENNT